MRALSIQLARNILCERSAAGYTPSSGARQVSESVAGTESEPAIAGSAVARTRSRLGWPYREGGSVSGVCGVC
jgi:hypothetical protein